MQKNSAQVVRFSLAKNQADRLATTTKDKSDREIMTSIYQLINRLNDTRKVVILKKAWQESAKIDIKIDC